MPYLTFGHRLPRWISTPLFGDRRQYGPEAPAHDPDWEEWNKIYWVFSSGNQRRSIGRLVNDAGYSVMKAVDLNGKKILEIGPGSINHIPWWRGTPSRYVVVDVREDALELACGVLTTRGISHEAHLLCHSERGQLPFGAEEFDVVVSFYSLEHLFPLDTYLSNLSRVLRRGGQLVGAREH